MNRIMATVRQDGGMWAYLAARVISGVAGLLVVKLLIELLSRDEFGTWGALGSLSSLAIPLVTLSTPGAMLRLYFDAQRDDRAAQRRVVQIGFSLMATSVIGLGLLVLAGSQVGLAPHAVAYLALVTTGSIAVVFFEHLARIRNDYGVFFFNRVVDRIGFGALLATALAVNSAAGGGSKLMLAIVLLGATKWLLAGVDLAIYRRRQVVDPFRADLDRRRVLAFLGFSAPRSATYIAGWALASSDVFLLHRLSSPAATADYFFALGLARLVAMITQAALTDWPTFYYAQLRDRVADSDARIAARATRTLWTHVGGILCLRLLTEPVYWVYGAGEYIAGMPLVGLLALGNYYFLAGSLLGSGTGYAKKTHLGFAAMAVPAAVNVGLNIWLIPIAGATAAAATTVVSYGLFAVAAHGIGRRFYRFEQPGRFLIPTAAATAIAVVPVPPLLFP